MAKAVQQSDVISILNNLIETCRDGQNGFREAAEHLKSPEFKNFCLEQSQKRAQFVGELQQEVRNLGGNPEKTGSTTGAIRRAWMDLKSALGGGDHAILSSCEAGEDAAVKGYQEALANDLPTNIRSVIERQYNNIQQSHNRVKLMRDSFK